MSPVSPVQNPVRMTSQIDNCILPPIGIVCRCGNVHKWLRGPKNKPLTHLPVGRVAVAERK